MKLLNVLPSVNPENGGPVEGVNQMNWSLTALGCVVETVCLDSPSDAWVKGFSSSALYALGPARTGYKYAKKFVPWMKQNAARYNCIIVHGIWQYSSFGVWLALYHSEIPYFVYPHGMLDPWFKVTYPLKHLKKWLYWPWAEYRVLRDARAVLFTCEEERRLARQSFWLYDCREAIVRFGTASPPNLTEEQHNLWVSTFPELLGKRIILFLGRLHPKKGCDLLIEAFAKIVHCDHRLHLVMAGPHSINSENLLHQQVEALGIAHRVTWTGMLSGSSKWSAFHAAEVFILPSHQENFGIAVIEAMACKLPVIISHKVNIWREIVDDKAGLVVENTTQGIIDGLIQWLNLTEAEKSTMGHKAQQSFMQRFEMNEVANHLMKTLTSYGIGS